MGKAKVTEDLDVAFTDKEDAQGFLRLLAFVHPESTAYIRTKSDGSFLIDIAGCFGAIKDFFPRRLWLETGLI